MNNDDQHYLPAGSFDELEAKLRESSPLAMDSIGRKVFFEAGKRAGSEGKRARPAASPRFQWERMSWAALVLCAVALGRWTVDTSPSTVTELDLAAQPLNQEHSVQEEHSVQQEHNVQQPAAQVEPSPKPQQSQPEHAYSVTKPIEVSLVAWLIGGSLPAGIAPDVDSWPRSIQSPRELALVNPTTREQLMSELIPSSLKPSTPETSLWVRWLHTN